YRGDDFERAASLYGVINSPEAAYNRGNALIMLGRYDEAIASFEKSLQLKPDWAEAQQNLEIARIRQERLQPPDDDAGGTGGMLGADKIVFDDTGRVNKSGSEVTTEGGEGMTDTEMREVWLRRVQSDPADFLRTRFSYQLYRDKAEAGDEPDTQ
ncbi:MAG: tetratricopeptide repeat protein, partial [Xanthomonadales bacterium]|nr:tetratricopeptide repeat protein [Xanthomonadales bacterium]